MQLLRRWLLLAAVPFLCLTGASASGAENQRGVGAAAQAASSQIVVTVPKEWADVASRLATIEKAVYKDEKSRGTTLSQAMLTGVIGLLGVFLGGVINYAMQRKSLNTQAGLAREAADNARKLAENKATQDRQLAENRAKLEIGNSFVQWELKQLSELYGPLRALLGQSNALYEQMNRALSAADSSQFQIFKHSDNRKEFQIRLQEQWIRFRTVLHIDKAYGKEYGVDQYFDEIVAIGERMVKIIEEKAGYVRPDQEEIIVVFGKYLAHYAILKQLHSGMRARAQTNDADVAAPLREGIKIDESAVFPQELQGLVSDGFDAISKELKSWRAKADH